MHFKCWKSISESLKLAKQHSWVILVLKRRWAIPFELSKCPFLTIAHLSGVKTEVTANQLCSEKSSLFSFLFSYWSYTLTLPGPGFQKLAQIKRADSAPLLTSLPCIRTKPNLVSANTIVWQVFVQTFKCFSKKMTS